ncbi:DUF7619 domain-containing protein [Flavobacterium sp.]
MKKTLLYLFLLLSTAMFSQFEPVYDPLTTCDDNNDGFEIFDLTSKIPEILVNSNPADYQVSFYETMQDATIGSNAIQNPSNYYNISSNIQTIYIGIVAIATNEVSVASMDLVVNAKPIVQVAPLTACFIQGLASFDLGLAAEQIWAQSNSNPNLLTVNFYYTQTDAINQANPLPYYFTTQNAVTTLFVNVTNTQTGCSSITILSLYADNCGTTPCNVPQALAINNVTQTAATASWTGTASPATFEYVVLLQGAAAPIGNQAGAIPTSVSQTQITGLTPNTCYNLYVRTICSSTENSAWSAGWNFCTLPTTGSGCGGTFIDNGGANGNYLLNSNVTTTICPSNVNDVVTVTFTAFNTETGWDGLYVYNGNSTSATLIPSTNAAGNNPALNMPGAFWGSSIPGPFTSTNPDGCLTFQFISDTTVVLSGWVANVTCAPPATCLPLTQVATSAVTTTSATVVWTNPNAATTYEVLLLPQGAPTPTATATGFIAASTNPFNVTGLTPNTCYTVYVRVRCAAADASVWSTGSNFCTQVAPPACGGTFVDNGGTTANYANNSNAVTTICPTIAGQSVTVTFTEFNTEVNWDALYVFDGATTSNTQIASTNGAANVPGGLAGGFWGTALPGPFTATNPDGCLTFWFRSDGSVNNPGWVANITCGSVDRVILQAFMDTNNNGIKDTGELNFNHGSFVYDTNNSGTTTEGYSPEGYYILSDDTGVNSYDIGYQIQSEYAAYFSAGTTTFTNITIPASSGTQNLYFPITVTQTYTDVAVTIVPINAPRAGVTNYKNEVRVSNLGSETIATTTLTFTKDSNLTVVSISDSGATNTPTGFTRIFTNLLPNESRSVIVNMSVPTIPTVTIGQVLSNMASVTPPTNDLLANNNSTAMSQPIVAAYDPNDKMESHGGKIQYDSFTQDDYLFYTIRFENTGNSNAIDVKVTDLLDNSIDETSVRMISASHDYVLTRVGSNLVWDFKDILLSVSIPNTQLGKGFITFKVKLKPGFAIGDMIPNKASIFFDTNPAIETNEFTTEFVQTLGTSTFIDSNLAVYPNPATSYVQIALTNSEEQISSVQLFDMLGKKIIEQNNVVGNQTSLNTSTLQKGMYLIEIKSNTNVKLVKKLVIQ